MNSLFWINMAISVMLGALMILISPLVADFRGEPQVAPLVAAVRLQLLIGRAARGAGHPADGFRQDCDRGARLATAAGFAYLTRTFWALFIGGLTTMTIGTLGVWISSRWRSGIPFGFIVAGDMVSFASGISGFTFADYRAGNPDHILIGRRWDNKELGLYNRANLLLFPLQQVTYPLGKVMVPTLLLMGSQPKRYRRVICGTRRCCYSWRCRASGSPSPWPTC